MAAGYYLIVDVTELEASAENTLVNLAMVRVTSNGTLTIETKNSAPTLVKKVQEKNDSNASSSGNGSWQDGADYDIGDEVPFQLTATLPTHYADYDSYKLVFHDTLATGLTYTNITKVYATNSSGDTVAEYASGTDYTVTRDSQNLTFTFSNLKTATDADKLIAGSKIIVEYTAKLNENATVGSAGNSNEAYLEYSNNPNADGSDSLGKTPVDKVLVFTYKIIVTKHGEADQLLPGATFKLSKLTLNGESENYVEVTDKLTTNADGDTGASIFTFTGLDAGIYKLEETDAPDGYDKIEYPILFEISATYNAESQTPAFGSLTITDNTQSTNASIDEEERFSINNTDGSISTTVKDTKGGVLPTTGGMGTTIFTVCGIVLMLGASILLVTRKRMSR
jgi:fimbrial isopeptide formation D2 family protein/LPXTG-motif cell wall-anchored protein